VRRITLVRHGHAAAHAEGGDFMRPLDNRGQREVARTAAAIFARVGAPSMILASPAVRTTQTATLLGKQLSAPAATLPIVFERSLYHADWSHLLEVLQASDDATPHLLLVGHNPGISELALRWSRHFPEYADFQGFGTAGWCSATFAAAATAAATADLSGLSVPIEAFFSPAPL
jgi:phosphohistidine phosphatase